MIPTAEKLLSNNIDGLKDALQDDDLYYFYRGVICEFAKGFAEMHVEAAKKEFHKLALQEGLVTEAGIAYFDNAYPLELIK